MNLDRKILIHCCKDRTLTYRTKEQEIFNGVALPVYSVDTIEEAQALIVITCRAQYERHPLLPGQPWYKITLDGPLDLKTELDVEDLLAVVDKLETRHQQMKDLLNACKS